MAGAQLLQDPRGRRHDPGGGTTPKDGNRPLEPDTHLEGVREVAVEAGVGDFRHGRQPAGGVVAGRIGRGSAHVGLEHRPDPLAATGGGAPSTSIRSSAKIDVWRAPMYAPTPDRRGRTQPDARSGRTAGVA